MLQKAEAGQPVHPDTLEVVAETLSTPDHPIFPEDLSASPREIARYLCETFAKYERQCIPHLEPFLAEDMKVVVPGNAELLPFCGNREGIDGFDEFWGAVFAVMERPNKDFFVNNMRIVGDGNEIVVLSREVVNFCGTGVDDTSTPVALVLNFERGKLTRFEDHFDTLDAEKTARRIIQRNAMARQKILALRA